MKKRSKLDIAVWILSILILLVFATFASAQATRKPAPTKAPATTTQVATQPMSIFRCDCVVQGTPVEFPDDIYISNTGTSTIAKGTILHWSIPGTTRQGNYTLAADLDKGKGVMVAGVLPGGAAAGTKCEVTKKEEMKVQAMPKQPMTMMYTFGCVVQGTPVEFPDDIYLSNKGTSTIKKGTTVHWYIPGTNRQGDYVLTEDMAAGKGVMVSGVLPGGAAAGTQCKATGK